MKKIVAFIMIFALIFVLSGCEKNKPCKSDSIEDNLQCIHNEYFDVEVIEDLGAGNLIIVDKNTNVLYLFVRGNYASAMTPIYNADGTPMIYKGGEK